MEYVSLDREPNQSFSLYFENYVLVFTFRYFRGVTYCTIDESPNGRICTSKPLVDKGWLLPKPDERKYGINLRLEDDNGEYPVYSNFNGSCVMVVYSQEEAEALREAER